MFEKNTQQVNNIIARVFAFCSVIILIMVACSYFGVFEFGTAYTIIIFAAGMILTISPSLLIKVLPPDVMKYYMLVALSVFIGVLGTNIHIGVYITYALVPIFSCLYFDPKFTAKIGVFSYIVMAVSLYFNSASRYEVVYLGRSRIQIYIAYLLGFTIEFFVVNLILGFFVRRAKQMMEERYSAEEANRMKSQFLSQTSHEIRTPMNAIIGMTDVALRMDMDDELRRCLTVIRSSSTGLLEIVNDILDLSKLEAGKLNILNETYSVKCLADDMVSIIDARNILNKVPVYYHISDDIPPYLIGDAVRIKQVMLNFASNAIKYTDSGRIDVTLSCTQGENGACSLFFSVKDTGHGIKQENMDKLFTMYSQFDSEKNHGKEGTGIGLAISKYFINCMDGNITAESVYGEGSTFTFTVPQKIADAPLSEVPNDDSFIFTTKGVHILIADDNELNREVLKALLEPLELEMIDEAENGAQAVEMAAHNSYDFIFMDSHMPVMSGSEAAKKIRGTGNTVPIIAVTADAVSGVKEQLINCGMDDYVVKPIDLKTLCSVIRKYLPQNMIK